MKDENPCIVAGKIYNHKHARKGDLIPFSRMAFACTIYTEQKLWESWRYLNATRPHIAETMIDLDWAIAALIDVADKLAFIESVVGYDEAAEWLENGVKRAAEIKRKQQRAPLMIEGEAS
jgi:hypothetical protein